MKSLALALLSCLALVSPARASCRDLDLTRRGGPAPAWAAEPDAVIQYFGHNFFQITTGKGTRIITDPLAPGMYPTPEVWPHVVTVGREHPNHNYVELARGNPIILRGLSNNLPVYQQAFGTALKGAAFIFDLGSLCIAHLGDLSHTLSPEQLKQIGRVDVALIPIGGVFTMPPDTAREVLAQLKPKIAIPMHYRDNMYILETFVQGLATRRPEGDTLVVSKSALPKQTEIVVLRPRGGYGGWGG